jgi:hypothetical protein
MADARSFDTVLREEESVVPLNVVVSSIFGINETKKYHLRKKSDFLHYGADTTELRRLAV